MGQLICHYLLFTPAFGKHPVESLSICFLLTDIADRCTAHDELEDYIEKTRQPSFRQVLFRLIDEKGAGDSDISLIPAQNYTYNQQWIKKGCNPL